MCMRSANTRSIIVGLIVCWILARSVFAAAGQNGPNAAPQVDAAPAAANNPNGGGGSVVVAPIPISSPAVGSGLLLIAGYVRKVNPDDELSPPSFIGGAGAFTNNGTRAGAFGGRLYFSRNTY